jgi:hypothetical protein
MLTLLKDTLISRVMNDFVAGTAEEKSSVLDMQGFDSVCFILAVGAVTGGGAVITATAKSNTASATTGANVVSETGASATHTDTGSDSNGLLVVDLIRASQRYVFLDVTRTTENVVIDGVIAIQYNAHNEATTPSSTIIASALAGPNA